MGRIAAHVDESFVTESGDAYVVALIEEGVAGYHETTYVSDDLAYLKRVAASINASRKLTADDVLEIRLSSMAATLAERRGK